MSTPDVLKVLPPSSPLAGGVYRSLEHWRGFAALWVMWFRAIGTNEQTLHPLVEALKVTARPGWLGVHLFFVISGYCIAANVQGLRHKGLGPGSFLRDRLCRILPTYWAAFAVTLLLAWVTSRFNHATNADRFPSDLQTWLGNLLLIQPYLGTKYYVIVYWTLVIEVGFNGLVTLLMVLSRVSVRLAAGLALALAVGAVWMPTRPEWLVLTCWPEFLCGWLIFDALQAGLRRERTRRGLCLAMIAGLGLAGALVGSRAEMVDHSPQQLAFAAGFALLLYVLHPLDDHINRAPALRWLSFCGVISFSLYLLHAPVGGRVYGLGSRFLPEHGVAFVALVLAFVVVSVGASYLFYRLFEARFERWRRHFKAHPLPVGA